METEDFQIRYSLEDAENERDTEELEKIDNLLILKCKTLNRYSFINDT